MVGRVVDRYALVGVQIGLYSGYSNESFFLLDKLEHSLNGWKEIRIDYATVIHKGMGEHEVLFGRNHSVIEVPGDFLCEKEILHGLKVGVW